MIHGHYLSGDLENQNIQNHPEVMPLAHKRRLHGCTRGSLSDYTTCMIIRVATDQKRSRIRDDYLMLVQAQLTQSGFMEC